MFKFLLGMWVMKKVDEKYLTAMVEKGFISMDEFSIITSNK